MSIEAVIFDWGGVLVDDPCPGITEFVANKLKRDLTEEAPEKALKDFQRGKIKEPEFWDELNVSKSLAYNDGKSLWREAFDSVYHEKDFVFDWIRLLQSQGIKTAVLSNTEVPAVEMFKDKGYDCFDELIFSCECKMVKPDKEIYACALNQIGVDADKSLFIDDRVENVEAASVFGMNAHLMKDKESLFRKAQQLGLPVLCGVFE